VDQSATKDTTVEEIGRVLFGAGSTISSGRAAPLPDQQQERDNCDESHNPELGV